jgi:hypothetical protein
VDGGYNISDRSTAVAKIVFAAAAETAHTLMPGSLSLAFYLQKNFVHSLDDGCEVCMIRNKKSH